MCLFPDEQCAENHLCQFCAKPTVKQMNIFLICIQFLKKGTRMYRIYLNGWQFINTSPGQFLLNLDKSLWHLDKKCSVEIGKMTTLIRLLLQ